MKTLEGKFLVASPYLDDPNFARTIVFVIKHDDDESFGVVINRPTKLRLKSLIDDEEIVLPTADPLIYRGGPVHGPLMALHDAIEMSEEEVHSELIISMEKEKIIELLDRDEVRMRIFYGYSGWGPRQLDQEIEQGGWIVTDSSLEQIFSTRDDLWESILIDVGREIITSGIDRRIIPADPSTN